jgi:methylmalonyl-CoA mutase N-terminal domain/subunit
VEAMAAVLGGTQSLHTNARDEALALPTEASAELALRTQQIIAHETRVTDAVDPLGGSYYVEALTNQLEADAEALIRKIDERGGAAAAIEQNFIQDEISRSAYETQKRIDSGEQVVVGLNKFTGDEEQIPELQQIDLSGVEQQKTRLKAFKEKRNSTATQKTLLALKVATENGDNLLPPILDAVRSHATLGEISSVLREVYGEYKE